MVFGTAAVAIAVPCAIVVAAPGGVAAAIAGTTAAASTPAIGEALIATGFLLTSTGPLGWIALGTDGLSWDCWRPVLRDFDSKEPRGRLLKDIAVDPRVVEVRSKPQEGYWPQIWLKNKWQEEFRIDYVQLPGGEIAAHAVRVQ